MADRRLADGNTNTHSTLIFRMGFFTSGFFLALTGVYMYTHLLFQFSNRAWPVIGLGGIALGLVLISTSILLAGVRKLWSGSS